MDALFIAIIAACGGLTAALIHALERLRSRR